MNLAERLSDYAASLRYQDLDRAKSGVVVSEAKKRLLDTVGCAIGASRERPVKAVSRLAQTGYRVGGATVLGTGKKTTVDMATFVNGAMVRYFDFNDTYLSKEPAHPSDNISACLATAETEGRTGKDLLVAMTLAYELQCRLCDAASLRKRGWDHVCYGLVSSALAAGRLMQLSRDELTQAVNISLNSHLAMRQVRAGELSEWKGFSFANAARNAVFSALLAREGLRGPSPIFEGEMGFFQQVSGPFELDTESFGGRKGSFKLEETLVKFFPSEYHAQSAIWAALDIREEIGSNSVGKITSVEVDTHEAGYTILGKEPERWAPETRETADHSFPYIVGMALLEGSIDMGSYSQRKLHDPRIREFMKKVSVREDKALTAIYPNSVANRITVRLGNGRVLAEQVDNPKGHPMNPMTTEEIELKFRRLTKGLLRESQVDRILDFVWTVEKQDDVSALVDSCVVR